MAADPVGVLVGTLDTKGHELEYMRDRVREALYDETRRKRVELASASAMPPENPERKEQQGDRDEV